MVNSMWRKCAGALTVTLYQGQMRDFLADFQYAAGLSDGIAAMSSSLNQVIHTHTSWSHAQIDVTNAFSSVDRATAFTTVAKTRGLSSCAALLGSVSFATLCSSFYPSAKGCVGYTARFLTMQGALSVFMEEMDRRGCRRHEHYDIHVSGETSLIPAMLQQLQDALSAIVCHSLAHANNKATCVLP